MTTLTPAEEKTSPPSASLSPETLLDMFWAMLQSRRIDERSWALHRQGKIAFHISGMGHEACQVAAAFAIHRGVDYVHGYYRDLALVLALGVTPRDFMISLFGKEGEYSSGGRPNPNYWIRKKDNLITCFHPLPAHVLQTPGLAS